MNLNNKGDDPIIKSVKIKKLLQFVGKYVYN